MIRSLRRLHRGTFVGIALALPVIAALGLLARPTFPTMGLPEEPREVPAGEVLWEARLPVEAGSGTVRVVVTESPAPPDPRRGIELTLEGAAAQREILVFWSAEVPGDAAPPAGDLRLLDMVRGGRPWRSRLPPGEGARLILRDPLRGEDLLVVDLPRRPGEGA